MPTLEEKVCRRTAALLVIDVQNDFCHENGASAKSGRDVSLVQAMVPTLNRLITDARQARVPVIFVRTTHSATTDSEVWNEWRTGRQHYICLDGSWGAEWYGVSPLPEDTVVTKHRYSGFVGTDLDAILRVQAVETVLCTGVATGTCVESTAREAFMRDYFTVIVNDCVADFSLDAHEEAIARLCQKFAVEARASAITHLWNGLKVMPPLA